MLEYSFPKLDEVYDECADMCGGWWYGSHFYEKTGMEYAPNREMFDLAEKSNSLLLMVGRDSEDRIGSMYYGFITPYLFNPSYLTASEVVWHISPRVQSAKTLIQFLKELRKYMDRKKVSLYSLAVPANMSGEMLTRYGFIPQDTIYMNGSVVSEQIY